MKQDSAREGFEEREFPMTDRDFNTIRDIAYAITGIKLSEHKRNMVYGRLARRLRKLQLNSFQDYCDLLAAANSSEHGEFVNAITTNLTAFFREGHHFEHLRNTVIPFLLAKNYSTKKIRIWSAGCSTGEEAYSIAMVLKAELALAQWDVKILATDLDTNVIAHAQAGIYSSDRAKKIPDLYQQYFQKGKDAEKVRIKSEIQNLVTFKQLNLLGAWPMKGLFDVIFCRNVVIYFDSDTQKRLFERYRNILTSQAYLYIGHSENLHNISKAFVSRGRTIYQRSD